MTQEEIIKELTDSNEQLESSLEDAQTAIDRHLNKLGIVIDFFEAWDFTKNGFVETILDPELRKNLERDAKQLEKHLGIDK